MIKGFYDLRNNIIFIALVKTIIKIGYVKIFLFVH